MNLDVIVPRFLDKIEITESCWLWTASLRPGGYGQFALDGTPIGAHRVSHMIWKGAIPFDYDVDHLCFNPLCVNPDHLEAVTHRENMRRSRGFIGVNSRKTHCINGHPFDESNTYFAPDGGRECRACGREWHRRNDIYRFVRNGEKTHCNRGHEFNEENTYYYITKSGMERRACRVCNRLRKQGRLQDA